MKKEKIILWLDRAIEGLIYLLIFFLPISKAAIEIIFGISFTLFLVKKFLKPDFSSFKKPAYFFLLLFFVFCALSLLNSGVFLGKSLKALFAKWLEYICIFIVVTDSLNTRAKLKRALFVLLATAFLIGLDGIYQKLTSIDFIRHRPIIDRYYITASFENQNSLGAYLAPVLILLTGLLFSGQKNSKYRIVLFPLYIILAIVLILVFSRSAWLTFIFGAILFFLARRNFKQLSVVMLIFIMVLVFLPAARNKVIYSNYHDRISLMVSSWEMIKTNPLLGKGLGTYMDYFQEYAVIRGVYYAHNCYLQIWAESGIFSLMSFVLFGAFLLGKAFSLWRRTRDYLLLGLFCAAAGLFVHFFFEVHLYSLQLAAFSWLMLGLLAAAVNNAALASVTRDARLP